GKTPWVAPADLYAMGYSMILYPTTVLFRAVHAMQSALQDLKRGVPLSPDDSVDLPAFEEIVNMPEWSEIDTRFMGKKNRLTRSWNSDSSDEWDESRSGPSNGDLQRAWGPSLGS